MPFQMSSLQFDFIVSNRTASVIFFKELKRSQFNLVKFKCTFGYNEQVLKFIFHFKSQQRVSDRRHNCALGGPYTFLLPTPKNNCLQHVPRYKKQHKKNGLSVAWRILPILSSPVRQTDIRLFAFNGARPPEAGRALNCSFPLGHVTLSRVTEA